MRLLIPENSIFLPELTLGLAFLSAACVAFGNSVQPISTLAFAQPVLLLLAVRLVVSRRTGPPRSQLVGALLVWFIMFIGESLAYLGLLNDPDYHARDVTFIIACSLGLSAFFFTVVYMVSALWWQRHDVATALMFAATRTAAWVLISWTPLGTFLSPTTALLDWSALTQTSAVWGVWGILFLTSWLAATLANVCWIWWLQSSDESHETEDSIQVRSSVSIAVGVLLLSSTIGGGLMQADGFFQRSIDRTAASRNLQVSCLLEQDLVFSTSAADVLWKRTSDRLIKGDDIVLWAETALAVNASDEGKLFAKAKAIMQSSKTKESYLGVTYGLFDDASGVNIQNKFVLFQANGSIAWNYAKAHPVPYVEAGVKPGPRELPTFDASFGRLGGAICFDLDFPKYVSQAGRHHVNILLQPSWTWGPAAERHYTGDAVRAVENGLHLFRCSSQGHSAVISPRNRVIGDQVGLRNRVLFFSIPVRKPVRTLYPYLSWVIEIAAVVLGGIAWLLLFVPAHLLTRRLPRRNYQPVDESWEPTQA